MSVVLLGITLLVCSCLYWRYRRTERMLKSVKFFPLNLLVTSLITVLTVTWRGSKGMARYFESLMALKEDCTSFLLGIKVFMAVEPDTIKAILSNPDALDKPYYYSFHPISDGAVFSCLSAKKWKPLRAKLNGTFNPKYFDDYIQVMNDKGKICLKVLKEMEMKTFNVREYMTRYLWDIVTVTHFGVDENQQVAKRKIISEVAHSMMEMLNQRAFSFWLHFSFIYNRSNFKKEFHALIDDKMEESENVVRKSLESYETKVKESSGEENVWKPYSQIYKEHYMIEENSIESITAGVNDLLIAGSDTSAVVTSHLLYNLGAHPECQEKLLQEVQELWTGQDWTRQQLSRMSYLDMAVQESLRLCSPFVIGRDAREDINIGKCTIPEGTTVIFSLKNSQMDERYFEQPARFNPDNFLPERVSQRPKGASLPFSIGPRDCPGKVYALFAIKCIVAEIVRNYRVETDVKPAHVRRRFAIMLEQTVYPIRLIPRKQPQE